LVAVCAGHLTSGWGVPQPDGAHRRPRPGGHRAFAFHDPTGHGFGPPGPVLPLPCDRVTV